MKNLYLAKLGLNAALQKPAYRKPHSFTTNRCQEVCVRLRLCVSDFWVLGAPDFIPHALGAY